LFGKNNGLHLWSNVLVEDQKLTHIVTEHIKRKRSH
jgi:hypothetical protein